MSQYLYFGLQVVDCDVFCMEARHELKRQLPNSNRVILTGRGSCFLAHVNMRCQVTDQADNGCCATWKARYEEIHETKSDRYYSANLKHFANAAICAGPTSQQPPTVLAPTATHC